MNIASCFSLATKTFLLKQENRKKEKNEKEKKKTVEIHFCLIFPVGLILPIF